jgi:hypothetical protein
LRELEEALSDKRPLELEDCVLGVSGDLAAEEEVEWSTTMI